MALGCGAKFAKIILIIYNIIFLLTGLFLIGLGIWLLADGSVTNLISLTFNGTSSNFFRNAAILLITMGVLVLFISVLGFVGAIIENRIVLAVYIGFLILIFCGEIAGGVVAIVYKDKIVYSINSILNNSLNDQLKMNSTNPYYKETKETSSTNGTDVAKCATSDIGYLWDFAQFTIKCCGVSDANPGYADKMSPAWNFQKMCHGLPHPYYPLSCCRPINDTTKFGDLHTNPDNQYAAVGRFDCTNPYTTGCSEAVAKQLERYAPVLIGIGIGFAMVELFGIIFAVCLCMNTGDDD